MRRDADSDRGSGRVEEWREEAVEEFADASLTSNGISTVLQEKADKRSCSWLLFKDAAAEQG